MWSLFGLMVAGAALFSCSCRQGLLVTCQRLMSWRIRLINTHHRLSLPITNCFSPIHKAMIIEFLWIIQTCPPYLIDALISTEDVRYYSHSGIDIIGLGRAVFKTLILNKGESGGGSTITQQLAKLLYSPRANNKLQRVFQKPVEWVIAAKLERFYSKDEIINLYLNKYDFNYNAVGIESAARTYFNKTPPTN